MKQQVNDLVQTPIPTAHGVFTLHYFSNTLDNKEHIALVMGEVALHEDVPVRIHSECFTGDVLGSKRCDCGEQLDLALQMIAQRGVGVLIYLRQEGRGIGLLKKLLAYNLQDQGRDTVDANLHLGYQADERDYTIAALMLDDLQIKSVELITNNPEKIDGLTHLGIRVSKRIPIEIPANTDNLGYLKTKANKMAHLLFQAKNEQD